MSFVNLSRTLALVVVAFCAAVTPAAGAWAAVPTSAPTAQVEPTPDPAASTTWTIEPADGEGADGRISLRHTVDPGGSVSDHVSLTNFSTRAATFAVYAGDGVVNGSGDFDIRTDGVAEDGGSWLTLGAVAGATPRPAGGLVVEVPAGSSVLVPLTVAVPQDATPGDHPAGVVAELVQGDGSTVQLASRVGVRVHLRVAGDVVAHLRVTDVHATWSPSWNPFARGTVRVEYVVENAGNVRLGSTSSTVLGGPFGAGEVSASATRREILPGKAVTVAAELMTWPTVRSSGSVTVEPGVVGEDELDVALAAASTGLSVWTVPWSQLVLLVLVGGLLVGGRWARRRRAVQFQARVDRAVAQARAEAAGGAGEEARPEVGVAAGVSLQAAADAEVDGSGTSDSP